MNTVYIKPRKMTLKYLSRVWCTLRKTFSRSQRMHTNTSFSRMVLKLEKQMDLRDSDLKNSLKLMCWSELSFLAILGISLFLSTKQYANLTNRGTAIYEHVNTDEVFSLRLKSNTKWQFISSSLLSYQTHAIRKWKANQMGHHIGARAPKPGHFFF